MNKLVVSIGLSVVVSLIAGSVILMLPKTHFEIPGHTMVPTIFPGEYIKADLKAFAERDPNRADVVVYAHPYDKDVLVVGRIVAVPGDSVDYAGGLVVNGEKLKPVVRENVDPAAVEIAEPPLNIKFRVCTETLDGKSYDITHNPDSTDMNMPSSVRLRTGEYFVLGDNRVASLDSRRIGPVPAGNIKGLATIIAKSARPGREGTAL